MSFRVALYLYAFLSEDAALTHARRVQRIALGGLVAAVREVSRPPVAEPDALRAQARVLDALSRDAAAILPARFGTLFPDPASLAERVERVRPKLLEALAHVAGCVQMNLRLFQDTAPAAVAAGADEGAVHPERGALRRAREAQPGPGARYLAERLAARTLPDPVRALLGPVRTLAKDERVEPSGPPPLRMNLYHLIPKEALRRYRSALARANRSEALPDVRWLLTGPFPPHAFAPEGLG